MAMEDENKNESLKNVIGGPLSTLPAEYAPFLEEETRTFVSEVQKYASSYQEKFTNKFNETAAFLETIIGKEPSEKMNKKRAFAVSLAGNFNTDLIVQNTQLVFYRNAFTAIVATLEARDEYTSHHSERVSLMCERFCRVIGLLPAQIVVAEITANIHDIGKVGISDATLKKPGKLDDDEWDEMKSHSVIGAEILMKAGSNLEFLASGIRSHHERYDGTGYPDGLKGEEIPYISRIIALCDSTDAMLSSRVYRRHLTEEICKEELAKNKGKMYQPELVDIFLENWDIIVGDIYKEVE